jgi:hypothetical protein
VFRIKVSLFCARSLIVTTDAVDPIHNRAIVLAESLAKSFADDGGELIDLFATFALFVTQEDAEIGAECLEALRVWASRNRAIH